MSVRVAQARRDAVRVLRAVCLAAVAVVVSFVAAAQPSAAAVPHHDFATVAYAYDAPARLLSLNTVATDARGSPSEPRATSWETSVSVAGDVVAAETESGLVNLASPARTSHILDGEVCPNGTFGGGHRAGTGFPGKSEFPATWSDAQVMHNISDVATDPSLAWRAGAKPGDFWVNGTRDGIDIEVLIRNDEIWTGYPTNVARNP